MFVHLKNCRSHLNVYRKGSSEFINLYHGDHERIAPILLEPEVGYAVINNDYQGPSKGTELLRYHALFLSEIPSIGIPRMTSWSDSHGFSI